MPSPVARTETASFPDRVNYLGGREQARAEGSGTWGRQAQGAQSASYRPQSHEGTQAPPGQHTTITFTQAAWRSEMTLTNPGAVAPS